MMPIEAVAARRGARAQARPIEVRQPAGWHSPLPRSRAKRSLQVAVDYAGQPVAERAATLKPARKWVVYLLPHSHDDIGYTHLQPEVMRRQWHNIDNGVGSCAARRPAIRPRRGSSGMPKCCGRSKLSAPGPAREAAATGRGHPQRAIRTRRPVRQRVDRPVPAGGTVAADAVGHHHRPALRREGRVGDDQRRAGLTWGIVAALAQAGVKYFSLGEQFHRRRADLAAWEDKPFYWLGPDGQHKGSLLAALPGLRLRHMCQRPTWPTSARARWPSWSRRAIPTTSCYLRWNVGGDNGPPDATLSDVVKNWNAKHACPKLVIATDDARSSASSRNAMPTRFRWSAAISRPTGRTGPARRPAKRPSTAPPPSGSCRPRRFRRCSARSSIRPSSSPTPGAT